MNFIKVVINNITCFFGKLLDKKSCSDAFQAVTEGRFKSVMIIDTPPTAVGFEMLKQFETAGLEVFYKDHHFPESTENTTRADEIRDACKLVSALLGAAADIVRRTVAPACSHIIQKGMAEKLTAPVILADVGADGLLAAMKAAGVSYTGLDQDAAILDGPRAEIKMADLTEYGWNFYLAAGSLPPFTDKTYIAEATDLYEKFVSWVEGEEFAGKSVKGLAVKYLLVLRATEKLAADQSRITEITPGLVLVDTVGAERFDIGVLDATMQQKFPNLVILGTIKDHGPIVKACGGKQYSFSVVLSHQGRVDLNRIKPADIESKPENGVIANAPFMSHYSEKVYTETMAGRFKELARDFVNK